VLGSVVWIGLVVFRVRNPHVQMTSWIMVLLASLSMPLLMHWITVTLSVAPVAAPAHVLPIDALPPHAIPAAAPPDLGLPAPAPATASKALDMWSVALSIYAAGVVVLLLRLALGLALTWRIARAATPIEERWLAHGDVRLSHDIDGPVTFGSAILVPADFGDWDFRKQQAVLAHERAHVANRDFYVLLLAQLNRALFWFSPFAWWQLARLAELAEIISDAEAIELVEDRLSYAEILLDLVQGMGRLKTAGLEMARASTVRTRVERLVAAVPMPKKVAWRQRASIALAILPVAIASSGSIAYRMRPPPVIAESATEPVTAAPSRPFVNFYSLGSGPVFAIFREDVGSLCGQLTGFRKLRLTVGDDGVASYTAGLTRITFDANAERQSSELMLHINGKEVRATRIGEMPRAGDTPDAALLDQYAGPYQLSPNRVLTLAHAGDRMRARVTARPEFDITPDGTDAFASKYGDRVILLRDDRANVTRALLFEPATGARLAPRIDAARAEAIEEAFARRIAQAPDRFREQVPTPGSREAVLRGIADLRHGAPNYERMSAALAAAIHRQASGLQAQMAALGDVETIFFRGVGPGGYDIYGVKFANGSAEFRILLGPDGKAEDVLFRPDGNDEQGGIAACSQEQSLEQQANSAPIRMLLYNEAGDGIQVFKLDGKGGRTLQATIDDNMSAWITTAVNRPLLVANRSGQCLEILLPGRRTQFHNVEPSRTMQPTATRRIAPLADSEHMLRQYIEGLGRGEPNYDRMTSQVAAQTRADLLVDRAILTRLGELRAISFRGVTSIGSDIYVTHFANGTAEWRIGLTKDGTIGRIALGPQ
jgi:beta-lactamase regulating signal transducer with metallopeptidase domain